MKAILVDKDGKDVDTVDVPDNRLTTPKVITVGHIAFVFEKTDSGFIYKEGDWYKI